jgi:hypothetical protein
MLSSSESLISLYLSFLKWVIFLDQKKLFQKTGFIVILSTLTLAISSALFSADFMFSQTHSKFLISLFTISKFDCLFSENHKSFTSSLVNLQIAILIL